MPTSRKLLVPHKVTVGGQNRIIKLPDIYDNANSTVGAILGVSKLPDNYEHTATDEDLDVSNGFLTGKLIRVRVSYRDGTGSNAKRKSSRLICSVDKAKSAVNGLLKKKFDGNDVIGAGFPRRRRLG